MAYQQSDLDKIDLAILNPQKKVVLADGRSVENYDLDQLRRLRADIQGEIAAAASQVNRRRLIIGRVCNR
jgi:hypothetical protein